jgi:predicted secreted protein
MLITLRTFTLATLTALTILCPPILASTESITVKEHDEFRIVLSENPSTGFSWFMSVSNFNTRLLRLLKSRFIPGHGIGAPGTRILRFKALEEGSTTIYLQYRGPSDQLGDTRTVHVTIN